MKYIDAEKLKTEIKRRRDILKPHLGQGIILTRVLKDHYNDLLSFITSLQQVQPEKSTKKNCNNCPHCIDRKDQIGWHFRGCFGGQYKGKPIAEIEECPLYQEQSETDEDDGKFVKISVRKEFAEQFQRLGDEIQAGQSSFFAAMNQQEQPQVADASKMEQPEVDLEDNIRIEFGTRAKVEGGKRYVKLDWDKFGILAYHFYALGQQSRIARKEE